MRAVAGVAAAVVAGGRLGAGVVGGLLGGAQALAGAHRDVGRQARAPRAAEHVADQRRRGVRLGRQTPAGGEMGGVSEGGRGRELKLECDSRQEIRTDEVHNPD